MANCIICGNPTDRGGSIHDGCYSVPIVEDIEDVKRRRRLVDITRELIESVVEELNRKSELRMIEKVNGK